MVINYFVYVPIILYSSHLFYKNRTHAYIENRRYKNSLFIAAVGVLFLTSMLTFHSVYQLHDQNFLLCCEMCIVSRPVNFASVVFEGSFLDNSYIRIGITNTAILWGLFLLLREWVLYFDHEKHCQVLAYKWKSQLQNELQSVDSHNNNNNNNNNNSNSNVVANSSPSHSSVNLDCKSDGDLPWAIKHQTKFKNTTKMHAYCFILWVFVTALISTSFYFSEKVFNYAQGSMGAVIASLLLIGYYHIHKCRDEINIRRKLYIVLHHYY